MILLIVVLSIGKFFISLFKIQYCVRYTSLFLAVCWQNPTGPLNTQEVPLRDGDFIRALFELLTTAAGMGQVKTGIKAGTYSLMYCIIHKSLKTSIVLSFLVTAH